MPTGRRSGSFEGAACPNGRGGAVAELTIKAVALGIILSAVLCAANVYLGLMAGMTVSASIPAAVISMGILRALSRRTGVLENNMVQTIASAGESIAAGVIFTVPALVMAGLWTEFRFLPTLFIGILGGGLGVLFMIPLRRTLIVEDRDLAYPEGVACAEILRTGERGGRDEATKVFILTLASVTGGTKALELTRSALKSGNRRLRDRAVQSLVRWPDSRAVAVLMDLARSAPEEKTRILAVRGYISVADRERNERKRVKMYKDVRELVKRVDEKKLIVSKLGNVREAGAIAMLSAYMDDPEVKNEAAMAAVNLVNRVRRGSRPELRALMQKVMESTTNKGVINRAKGALRKLGR